MARRVALLAGTSAVLAGMAAIPISGAADGARDLSNETTIVGCVAAVDGGFLLRMAVPDMQARNSSAGTNSAKASTPMRQVRDGDPPQFSRSAGSNSAKASTPVRAVATATPGPR